MRKAIIISVAAAATAVATAATAAPAGSTASYADGSGDAYVLVQGQTPKADQAPNPVLNTPSQDITSVGFATGSHPHTYTASMTVSGTPAADTTYVSAATFGKSSDNCRAFYFLSVNSSTFVNFFCGTDSNGNRYFIGSTAGKASVTGSTITGTFSSQRLPSQLVAAGSTIGSFLGWSCPSGGDPSGNGCVNEQIVDYAQDSSGQTFALN
jgi:hypothetical protein